MADGTVVAVLALLAGALALDTTAALQVMVSQPLVAGTIAGALVGDIGVGTAVGAVLQLVWVGALPVGAAAFPDAAVGSVSAVGVAVLMTGGGVSQGWAVASGITAGLVAGAVGARVIGSLRRFSVRFATFAAARAEDGDASGVVLAVAGSLAARFGAGAALAAAVMAIGLAAAGPLAGAQAGVAFPAVVWAAPIAAATVVAKGKMHWQWAVLALGFVIGLTASSWR